MSGDKKMHDIVCSRCGAHDMVPFRPRAGSVVMCRTCYSKNNQKTNSVQDRRSGLPVAAARKTWLIHCSECGNEDNVPFEPRPDSTVFCRGCHDKRKERKRVRDRYAPAKPRREAREGVHIPRVDHGTRVSYPIVCEGCGKHETLNYVPNTSGPILCTGCASNKFGRSWYQVDLGGDNTPEEHSITCSECNRTDTVPFKPQPNREYHCRRCLDDQSQPDPKRLKNFDDFNEFVKVRRS